MTTLLPWIDLFRLLLRLRFAEALSTERTALEMTLPDPATDQHGSVAKD